MDLENEMIPQIIKVKADNKMKNILYYLNDDKKCEILLFYHFLFRLSLLSKRGLQHRELLLHCSREYLLRTLFLFFWNIEHKKLDMILAVSITYKTQRELNQGIKTEKYEIK